jgi:hypothetical protein
MARADRQLRALLEQDPAISEAILEEIKAILMKSERALGIVGQGITEFGKPRDFAVATDSRIIIYRKHLFGRASIDAFKWEDVKNTSLDQGFFSSKLTVDLVSGTKLVIEKLKKNDTKSFHAISQEKVNEWRDRRRVPKGR